MAKCPICKKESEKKFRPFCSERCKAVDLNRWFTGSYAIPSESDPEEEKEQHDTE